MPNDVKDAAHHRTTLGEVLSRWRGGAAHAPSSDDVAAALVDAMVGIANVAIVDNVLAPVSPADHILDRVALLGERLGVDREVGESLLAYAGRVLDDVKVTTREAAPPVPTDAPVADEASPPGGWAHHIRATLGYIDSKDPAERAVSMGDIMTDLASARAAIHGALTETPGPGLADGISKIAAATNDVRAALLQALIARPGEYKGATLVKLAELVRDRLKDTRARSQHWHDYYRTARGLIGDLLAMKPSLEALSKVAGRVVDLDDQTTGIDPQ